MKFKMTISMIALSVVSASAFAAVQPSVQQSSKTFMNQQLAKMTNSAGVTSTADWYHRIKVSGLLNLDAFAQNNDKYLESNTDILDQGLREGSESAFNVSTLALNVDGQVNDWMSAHVSLFYATSSQPNGISGSGFLPTRYYPAGEAGSFNGNLNGVDIDDAYVDVMNFNKAPIDLRVGRQYFGFGQYDRYAMMPTLTQQMTELRGTGAQLNLVYSCGLHADAFALRGMQRGKLTNDGDDFTADDGFQLRNFGGMVGYTGLVSKLGFDINAGYLYNIDDVGAIAQSYDSGYVSRAGAWNANGALMTGPFKLGIQYVASTAKIGDFSFNTSAAETKSPNPDAGNIYGSYAFKTMGYNSKFMASYQWSNEALMIGGDDGSGSVATRGSNFSLPESRVAGEYDINVMKNTMVGLEVNYDSPYSKDHDGSGDNSLTGIARLSVLL